MTDAPPKFVLADSDGRIFVVHLHRPFFFGEVLFSGAWARGHFKVEPTYLESVGTEEENRLICEAENFYWRSVKGSDYKRRKKPSTVG